jgi:predicted porin
MKKVLLVALLAAAGIANADVALYGVLDTGVMTQSNGAPADPNAGPAIQTLPAQTALQNGRVTGMYNGGLSTSRWGITGSDKESGAVFRLESVLNLPYGTNPNGRVADSQVQTGSPFVSSEGSNDGQMFARESTVGLVGKFGELRLGRQTTVMADHIADFDAVGGYFSPLAYNGGYGGAGFTAEARWDQSLKFKTTVAPGVTVHAGYKFGATNSDYATGSAVAAGVDYQVFSMLKLGAVYERNHDAQSVAAGSTAGTLKLTTGDTRAYAAFAEVTPVSTLSVKVGGEQIYTENPFNPAYDQSINMISNLPVTAYSVTSYTVPRTQNMFWATTTVNFAPTWSTSLGVYQLNTSPYGSSTSAATAQSESVAKYFAGNVVKSLSKQTDVYVTASASATTGPVWTGQRSVESQAIGLRVKF